MGQVMKTVNEIIILRKDLKDAEEKASKFKADLLTASATGWRAEAIERLGGRIEVEYPRAVRVDADQLYLDPFHVSLGAGGSPERQLEILDFARDIIQRRIDGEDI